MNTPIPTLTLHGRFDAHTVPTISAQLASAIATSPTIVLDLADVHFVDSSALGILVQYMKRCRTQGGELYLCALCKSVQIVFELTRMNQSFTIVADTNAAYQALAG